jgi:catechol 2,3-dioxygenase
LPELGHIALFVQDLASAKQFYTQAVGLRPVGKLMKGRAIALTGGRTHHELLLIETGDKPSISPDIQSSVYHFAWKVGDSLDDLKICYDRLLKMGISIEATVDHLISKSLYLRDPDGNRVELYVDDPQFPWRQDISWLDARPKPLQF